MALPRGVRSGFVGIPGPRTRRREALHDEPGELAARYTEAVRRHDEALDELRRIGAAMAEALAHSTGSGKRGPAAYGAETSQDPYEVAPESPGAAAAGSEAETALQTAAPRRRRQQEEETTDADRPTNLRCERNAETGSMCLSWDATARAGLVFGIWRSVTPMQGPSTPFERLAMAAETGYIDDDAPSDARRISYAVRALDGRRPVPGSAHVSVTLQDDA